MNSCTNLGINGRDVLRQDNKMLCPAGKPPLAVALPSHIYPSI